MIPITYRPIGFWAATDEVLRSWRYRIYSSSVGKCTDPAPGWNLFLPLVLADSESERLAEINQDMEHTQTLGPVLDN